MPPCIPLPLSRCAIEVRAICLGPDESCAEVESGPAAAVERVARQSRPAGSARAPEEVVHAVVEVAGATAAWRGGVAAEVEAGAGGGAAALAHLLITRYMSRVL